MRRRPREIVWVYVSKHTQYGAPISAQLVLGLSSGKRVTVNADLGREHELLRALRVVPDVRIFELARDFLEALRLDIEVKDTP